MKRILASVGMRFFCQTNSHVSFYTNLHARVIFIIFARTIKEY
jgi:hypothetical protein